jgi:DNA gyrase/topoisomerase IV subunit B
MAPKKIVQLKQAKLSVDDALSAKYKKMDQQEHVLAKPGMYIGSIEADTCDVWVVEDGTMVKKNVKYVPGLFKIYDEIVVNAIDHSVRLKEIKDKSVEVSLMKTIRISINKETGIIEVTNDGDGIEIAEHPEHKIYIPEMIFGNLLTSTNYSETEERTVGGTNGLGSKCANIFSKWFEVETVDAHRKLLYKQRFENNMTSKGVPEITKFSKKPYTTIRFLPDYTRFGMNQLSDDMYKMMEKRAYDVCGVTDNDITVYFNDAKLDYKTFEKYVDLYIGGKDTHTRVYEKVNERWEVIASYNNFNGFEQISFVNGIWTIRGGKHVEYIVNQIVKKLTEIIQKKKKDVTVKPQTIRDNLILFVKSTIVNPAFDSQSKETLTTPMTKFGSKAEISDKFIEKLYKSGIVEKILEISEIHNNKQLAKTDGKKRNIIRGLAKLEDANWAGTAKSKECTLILTEGDSITGDTPLLLKENDNITIKTIETIATNEQWNLHDDGKEYNSCNYKIWTENGWTNIKHIFRHKVTKNLFRVLTHTGVVDVTEDHSLIRDNGEEIAPKDCKVNDLLLHSFPHFNCHKVQLPDNLKSLPIKELWVYASKARIPYYQGYHKHELINILESYKNIEIISEKEECEVTVDYAYVLGLFFADGSCNFRKNCYWKINNCNITFLEKCKNILAEVHPSINFEITEDISSRNNGYQPLWVLVIRCPHTLGLEICTNYRKWFYDDFKQKRVPDFILNASFEVRESFFNGYYDGDGQKYHEYHKKPSKEFRLDFEGKIGAHGMFYLARSLGFMASINIRSDKKTVYRLNLTKGFQQDNPKRIKKIWDLGKFDGYVYDIETENHHFQAGVGQMIVHNSAASMAVSGLSEVGRDRYGIFPLKGKLMNVKDQTIKKIAENEEISNIKKILGLETGKEYNSIDDLRYGKIMLMTDSDVDGHHIKGLLFNMFHSMWPSLIKCDMFVTSMLTPIVKVNKNNNVIQFYNLTEYENWKKATDGGAGWEIKYYKGLGTSTSEEAKHYFRDLKMINYKYSGEASEDKLDLAFNKKKADERKDWLGGYDRQRILDYNSKEVTYEDFIDKELIHFSNYDVERSIPNMCDGLKVSQRKILFSCFKRNLTKEIKVAQLAGYVSENAAYHHGEASLQSAIIGMAQNFVGSNNINVLKPNGQFGSRRLGGSDAASPRYIFTQLSDITSLIINKADNSVLTYLNDDGVDVEPEYYMPIIPMILVNGAIGIGTGFSTNIPCYNPLDIVRVIKSMLNNDTVGGDLIPWYRGFKGIIELNDKGKYVSRGTFVKTTATKVDITELPVGMWTQDFKELLEEYLDKSQDIKNYESHYTETDIKFTLHFANSTICDEYLKIQDNGYTKLENELKLVSSKLLGTTNMYLFNSKCQIQKYNGPLDIIREFYTTRLIYYQKRKDKILEDLIYDIQLLENKIRFIREVVAERIVVHKMKKDQLEKRLSDDQYSLHNGTYDYILRIPIYNLTIDKVEDLENEKKKADDEINRVKSIDTKTWWSEELDVFSNEYNKFLDQSKSSKKQVTTQKKLTVSIKKQ